LLAKYFFVTYGSEIFSNLLDEIITTHDVGSILSNGRDVVAYLDDAMPPSTTAGNLILLTAEGGLFLVAPVAIIVAVAGLI